MPTAKDLMTSDLIVVGPDDPIDKAISTMLKYGVSGLPVADSAGRLLGVISEFDLLDLVWDPKTAQDKVYQYMTRDVHTVAEDADLTGMAETFRTMSIRRLPVVRDGIVVGIVSRRDLLRHILQARGHFAPVVPRMLAPADSPISNSVAT